MEISEYHEEALTFASPPDLDSGITYPVLGLLCEAGQVAAKVNQVVRECGEDAFTCRVTRERILRELGDVLWYVAVCSRELGADLEAVAELNLQKLRSRGSVEGLR
jgi:NTP pyrophosphatase (non-canonical NTP hydrolase)